MVEITFIWFLVLSAGFPLVQTQLDPKDILNSVIELMVGQISHNENGISSKSSGDGASNDKSNKEIFNSTAQEIIERSGYKQETYEVVSDDGYITQLIHIINPLVDGRDLKSPPVVIFHGGGMDSSGWIVCKAIQHHPEKYPRNLIKDGPMTSYNRSLGFMLANNGYDVWLVSTRGSNRQNMGHTRYRTKLLDDLLKNLINGQETIEFIAREFIDNFRYFDYTFDNLVKYEAPRQIEAVLHLTGSKRVSVISYSFSTIIMFKALTSNKALAKRVHNFVALNSLLNLRGTNWLIRAMWEFGLNLPQPFGNLLVQILFSSPMRNILRELNHYGTFKLLNSLFYGSSAKQTTNSEEQTFGHVAMPIGSKQILHADQMLHVSRLQKFDYGPEKNFLIYGNTTPPIYNLSEFKVKRWMIIKSANDVLGTPDSTDEYVRQIRVKPYRVIENIGYNHVDTISAYDNDIKVNLPILEFFNKFQIIT